MRGFAIGQVWRRTTDAAAIFIRRLRRSGWISARTYAKYVIVNAWLRLRNRMARRPRVECPCCGWRGYEFRAIDCGTFTVPAAECPHCKAHERHRMLHIYLMRACPDFMELAGFALHFAPEPQVSALIRRNAQLQCIHTDYAQDMIRPHRGTAFQSDMQHLSLADNAVAAIFCLHVLEHVPNDRLGLDELRRALCPGGIAYIMVPFMMDWKKTIEFGKPDPEIYDHYRGYSPLDFEARLASFTYDRIDPKDFLSPAEIRRFRIPPSQVIFRCVKQP